MNPGYCKKANSVCSAVSFKDLVDKPYRYIPTLFKIQKALYDVKARSFNVVPLSSYKLYHIQLTMSGIHELMQRVRGNRAGDVGRNFIEDPDVPAEESLKRSNFSAHKRLHCEKLFKLERYEKPNKTFYCFTTDGYQASITFESKIKPTALPGRLADGQMPDADFLVGLDPGRRLLIAGVKRDIRPGANVDMKPNERTITTSTKEWHHRIHEHGRRDKLKKYTGKLEEKIAADRKRFNNTGPSHPNYKAYTRFELKWFVEKCKAYFTTKVAELKFEKYCAVRKAATDLAKEICPRFSTKNPTVPLKYVVFLGACIIHPDNPIKK